MDRKEWYFEYELQNNRPGLLGDISSLLGMLSINIIMINSIENSIRGMLLLSKDDENITGLQTILNNVDTVKIKKLRVPKNIDRLAVRHGKYIHLYEKNRKTVKIVREECAILGDDIADIFKSKGNKLIGVRGMPRVGKTESIVAGSVSANKKWLFVSNTLLKQTVRNQLIDGEYGEDYIYIIDGIVSQRRSSDQHWQLIREIMNLSATNVIEHPDIFVQTHEYSIDEFDYINELRRNKDEKITYETIEGNQADGFSMFDSSGG